jgi:valyl-tRNA synthetase
VDKLANVEVALTTNDERPTTNCSKFIVGTTEFAIPMDQFINVDEEIKKLEADLAHQQGFLRGVMAKLSNERFVQNAKPEIVALEQKKKSDAEARIAAIEEAIRALKG